MTSDRFFFSFAVRQLHGCPPLRFRTVAFQEESPGTPLQPFIYLVDEFQ